MKAARFGRLFSRVQCHVFNLVEDTDTVGQLIDTDDPLS